LPFWLAQAMRRVVSGTKRRPTVAAQAIVLAGLLGLPAAAAPPASGAGYGAGTVAPPAAGSGPPADGAIREGDRLQARELYTSTCVSCHGPEGRGNGLAAVGLPAKPASFSDPAWQRATSDEQIARAIVGGGAAVGKSPLMPPNPQLADKPGIVAALRAMIRAFDAAGPGAP
jgi:mono/diheme cytochrome c family protein